MPETARRLLVAVPLVAAFGGVLVIGHWLLWLAITLAAAAIAAMEWGKLAGMDKTESIIYAALFALLCLVGAVLFDLSPDDDATNPGGAAAVLAAAAGFWILLAPLLMLGGIKMPKLVLQVAGMILLFAAWMGGVLLFAADVVYVAAAVGLVVVADVAAYLSGKVFGKSSMASSISPGKTWEGFYGAFAAVLLLAFALGRMIVDDAPLAWLLAAAFALMVLSVVGDLFASLLKRQAGVKDSGTLLGAHGGVIDRIDAILPVLPCAAILAGLPS